MSHLAGTTTPLSTYILEESTPMKLLLFLLLLILCWPAALVLLVLYPIVWLVLLPFRLAGLVVLSAFEFIRTVLLLPARALRSI